MEKRWSRAGATAESVVCIATFLPLRRWLDVPSFVRLSMRVEAQLKQTPGVVRYALKTRLPQKHFWTFSAWMDRSAMNSFVAAEPHRTAVARFERWAGPGAAFVEWKSSDRTPRWEEIFERLAKPTFYYTGQGRS